MDDETRQKLKAKLEKLLDVAADFALTKQPPMETSAMMKDIKVIRFLLKADAELKAGTL